jgi:hypothetical protein
MEEGCIGPLVFMESCSLHCPRVFSEDKEKNPLVSGLGRMVLGSAGK